MNQPGGTRGPDEWRRDLIWSALFLLAALVGGLAAADLTHVSTTTAVIVSVLVAVVATVVVHYALPRSARADVRPVNQPTPPGAVERPARSIPPAPDQQVAVVRLLEPQKPVTKSWWNSGESTSAAGTAAAEVPVAPGLSSYLDSALVAQCPNCGSFRMDTDQTAPEWRFRCQECQQIWAWRPGNPWPAVLVRPRLRKKH